MKKPLTVLFAALLFFLSMQNTYAQNETLRFGTGFFYPPFVYSEAGGRGVYGFDIEVVLALCKQLNDTCVFSQAPLPENLQKLDNGEIDATIGAFSITNARKAKYDFAGPYYKDTMSFLKRTDTQLTLPQDLAGKTVGSIRSSTFNTYLEQNFGKNIKIKTYTTTEELIDALSNKKVDLILVDTPVATYWIKNSSGSFIFVTGGQQILAPFDEGYGIAFRLGSPQRVAEFNNALLTIIKNGTYDAIKKRYF